jgi:hypothetical protein
LFIRKDTLGNFLSRNWGPSPPKIITPLASNQECDEIQDKRPAHIPEIKEGHKVKSAQAHLLCYPIRNLIMSLTNISITFLLIVVFSL